MQRAARLVTVAAVLVAVLGLHPSPAPASESSLPLRRTNWILTDRESIGTPLDGVVVNAVFGTKRVEGSSGCNGYSSSYTTHGSRIAITNDGVSTLIACSGAAGEVEPRYLATLERVGRWRIKGSTLTLSTGGGRRLLVYQASVGAAALRGDWDVTSLSTGTAVSSPVSGTPLTLKFTKTKVSGDTGCNIFDGPYETRGADRIELGPMKQTTSACRDRALETQAQQYVAALGRARTYRVTGDQLTLYHADDTIAVTARRVP